MPSVRRRAAAAPAMRRHCDTSRPARRRAAEIPAERHPTTPLRRLKIFSQATARVPPRRHDVGSRLSLNTKPGANHCRPGEVDRRLLPPQDRVSLGAAADRTPPPGAGAQRQHQGRAGERPPFYTLRAHPNEHPARDERSSGRLPTADGDSWQRQGHSHSKPKNLFPCYRSVGQFLCWEEPCKLPR